jgi:hypothetical protein
VHHKEVAVLFPLDLVFDEGKGIKGIAEIGFQGFFKPVNVLNGIVGALNIMEVIEPVVLFFIGNIVGVEGV